MRSGDRKVLLACGLGIIGFSLHGQIDQRNDAVKACERSKTNAQVVAAALRAGAEDQRGTVNNPSQDEREQDESQKAADAFGNAAALLESRAQPSFDCREKFPHPLRL